MALSCFKRFLRGGAMRCLGRGSGCLHVTTVARDTLTDLQSAPLAVRGRDGLPLRTGGGSAQFVYVRYIIVLSLSLS